MKKIELTEEQLILVIQALGIAEDKFSTIYKTIKETTLNVRNHIRAIDCEENNNADFYHEKACKFADLNSDLNNLLRKKN